VVKGENVRIGRFRIIKNDSGKRATIVLIHRKLKDIQPVWWKKGNAAAEVIFYGGQGSDQS
jgi:hypothetical protein